MGLLERILEVKKRELPRLRALALPTPPARTAIELGRGEGGRLHLIAEIKHRSPSAGELSRRLSVAERAKTYADAGASMVSVLCDESFFGGGFEQLAEARRSTLLPLLCKEFVIDEVQLEVARAFGADAVLLIVRCLEAQRLPELVEHALALELLPFVEITSHQEGELAVAAGATLIGVNARDLDTLDIDMGRAEQVLAALPASVTRVHLSGVKTPEDVRRVKRGPADAALIGEILMREDEPRALLASLAASARN